MCSSGAIYPWIVVTVSSHYPPESVGVVHIIVIVLAMIWLKYWAGVKLSVTSSLLFFFIDIQLKKYLKINKYSFNKCISNLKIRLELVLYAISTHKRSSYGFGWIATTK